MSKNNTASAAGLRFNSLDATFKQTTTELIALAANDHDWWVATLPALTQEALTVCLQHLQTVNDATFDVFAIEISQKTVEIELPPLEALCWLAALCELDRLCIGTLPRDLIEEVGLQWRVAALHWLG